MSEHVITAEQHPRTELALSLRRERAELAQPFFPDEVSERISARQLAAFDRSQEASKPRKLSSEAAH